METIGGNALKLVLPLEITHQASASWSRHSACPICCVDVLQKSTRRDVRIGLHWCSLSGCTVGCLVNELWWSAVRFCIGYIWQRNVCGVPPRQQTNNTRGYWVDDGTSAHDDDLGPEAHHSISNKNILGIFGYGLRSDSHTHAESRAHSHKHTPIHTHTHS